jgi:hypothetical protein
MMSPVVRMTRPFTLERMDRVFPVTGEAAGTSEKILVAVRVEDVQRRRAIRPPVDGGSSSGGVISGRLRTDGRFRGGGSHASR